MNINIKKDFVVSIFFALLATVYLYSAQNISVFSPFGDQGLDSKSIPHLIGGLMLLLSMALFVITLLRYRKTAKYIQLSTNFVAKKKKIPIKLLASITLLTAYIALYQYLGFILSSITYQILQSLLLAPPEKRKKWVGIIVMLSVILTVVVYYLFSKYLSLFLPAGILG